MATSNLIDFNTIETDTKSLDQLDTVKALHDTVISLRTALGEARNEIDQLKRQLEAHHVINEGKRIYANDKQTENIKLNEPESKRIISHKVTFRDENEEIPETGRSVESHHSVKTSSRSSTRNRYVINQELNDIDKSDEILTTTTTKHAVNPTFEFFPTYTFKDEHNPMASKIDVKIKVTSNITLDSGDTESSTTSEPAPMSSKSDESESDTKNNDEKSETLESSDNANQSKPEESVAQKNSKKTDFNSQEVTSARSASDGDDSVFEDNAHDPEMSGSEKLVKTLQLNSTDNQEDVDDIELIFSAYDKDIHPEDLESIADFEPLQAIGTTGTPILVKFSSLSTEHESNLLPQSMSTNIGFNDDDKRHSFSSFDSFCDENTKPMYESNKSSSMDRESSSDQRDGQQVVGHMPTNKSFSCRKWTHGNIILETDISKCGIADENILEMGRRNTCPNPPPYRPIIHREALAQTRHTSTRCPLAVKFSRNARAYLYPINRTWRPIASDCLKSAPKRSSSAQTVISALPEQWGSENQLGISQYGTDGFFTLPSKFVSPWGGTVTRPSLRVSEKTQEARRVLLSDINFTSMVPELSRSADHLLQDGDQHDTNQEYYKGNTLKTPDFTSKGLASSTSITSPGISQWTVNEISFGTQTSHGDWRQHGDSFDSCKSSSMGSRYSNGLLNKANRSRSVPIVLCAICKQNHGNCGSGMRTSESMHYTPRVQINDNQRALSGQSIRGSLPDLRFECTCARRFNGIGNTKFAMRNYSSGSTDSLLNEADDFVQRSLYAEELGPLMETSNHRRSSEADIMRNYVPSKQALPFLPKSSKCLKPGFLAKVIAKNGCVVIGRVRYVGPLVVDAFTAEETYVGLQLQNKLGDCDGSIDGRRFFDCDPNQGIFVPFKKVVMAWNA